VADEGYHVVGCDNRETLTESNPEYQSLAVTVIVAFVSDVDQ
jgi:hypothetical protein